jgi:hypothetical protein
MVNAGLTINESNGDKDGPPPGEPTRIMIVVGQPRRIIPMQNKAIGIDLGKTTFHLVALNSRSQVVVRKKVSRQHLLTYTAIYPRRRLG